MRLRQSTGGRRKRQNAGGRQPHGGDSVFFQAGWRKSRPVKTPSCKSADGL